MIGLDAADLGYIRSNLVALPSLQRLFEIGRLFPLDTTSGLLTGSVWPTFYTGTLPGEHGIYHNLQWDPDGMRLRRVSQEWLDCEPFWYELDRRGIRVTVLDMPMSIRPRMRNGIEVLNWGAHDELGPFECNRPQLAEHIHSQFGKHDMGGEVPVDKTLRQRERIRDDLIRGARKKAACVKWLLANHKHDLFIVVFGETHRAGHILWPSDGNDGYVVPRQALLDVYQAVDESIGQIVASLPEKETTVIVFALHGMEANLSQEQFMSPLIELANMHWHRDGKTPLKPTRQRSLMRVLRDRVPAGAQHMIAQGVPAAVRDWVVNSSLAGGRNWERTPAFPLHADLNGYVRLNIKGREKLGMLDMEKGEVDRYVARLYDCIESFRIAESGKPLVLDITRVEDAYPGTQGNHLPDIVVKWTPADRVTRIESSRFGVLQARRATGRGGNHRD